MHTTAYLPTVTNSLSALLFASLFFFGCRPDEPAPTVTDYRDGLLICNEGIFNQSAGSVSFYQPQNKTVQNDIFRLSNGRDLGNVLQSITVYNDKIYMVVNNSNRVEVANMQMGELAQLNLFQQPRYLLPINPQTAYVSQWGSDGLSSSVKVINLTDNSLLATVPLYKGAEKMLQYQNRVWVCNGGGYDTDNRLALIDPQTHQLDTVFQVGDNPHSLQVDGQNRLWVACGGKIVYSNYPTVDSNLSTSPSLYCFQNRQLVQTLSFPKTSALSHLVKNADGSSLFFTHNNQIIRFNTQTSSYQPIYNGNFYGLGLYQEEIYAARNMGTRPATVLRMSQNGAILDSFTVSTFANGLAFY